MKMNFPVIKQWLMRGRCVNKTFKLLSVFTVSCIVILNEKPIKANVPNLNICVSTFYWHLWCSGKTFSHHSLDLFQHAGKKAHLVLPTTRSIHGAVQLWVAGRAHRAPQGAAYILEGGAERSGVILTTCPLVCEPNVHVFFMKSNSTNEQVI